MDTGLGNPRDKKEELFFSSKQHTNECLDAWLGLWALSAISRTTHMIPAAAQARGPTHPPVPPIPLPTVAGFLFLYFGGTFISSNQYSLKFSRS